MPTGITVCVFYGLTHNHEKTCLCAHWIFSLAAKKFVKFWFVYRVKMHTTNGIGDHLVRQVHCVDVVVVVAGEKKQRSSYLFYHHRKIKSFNVDRQIHNSVCSSLCAAHTYSVNWNQHSSEITNENIPFKLHFNNVSSLNTWFYMLTS